MVTIIHAGYLALLLGCSQSTGSNSPIPNQTLVGELKRLSPLFVMSYTAEFADRFKLPADKAKTLSTGLDAIAIEIRPNIAQLDCLLHLYINDKVDIYVPNNNPDYSIKQRAEYFFAAHYSKADLEYNIAEVDKAFMRIVYRSKSVAVNGEGWIQTSPIERIKKNFLPNLSILSLDMGCGSALHPEYAPAEIVVQKANTGDYKVGLEDVTDIKQTELIYTFDIPLELHRSMKKYVDFAVKFNTSTYSSLGTDEQLPTMEIH